MPKRQSLMPLLVRKRSAVEIESPVFTQPQVAHAFDSDSRVLRDASPIGISLMPKFHEEQIHT